MNRLDPRIVSVWMLTSGLWTTGMVLLALLYDGFHFIGGRGGFLPTGVLTLVALLAGAVLTLILPRLRYRYWRYEIRPEEMVLERGVFNRVCTLVPLRRVQHLDVSQNLIEREFDLGKLVVHTAGSVSGQVVLPGLPFDEAGRIRDDLRTAILEEAY